MLLLLNRLNQGGKAIPSMPRTLPLLHRVSRAVAGGGGDSAGHGPTSRQKQLRRRLAADGSCH